ncbi:helix-turn-helix domain-containing protein [Kitasatospora sp. NPDC088548]|uniref:helix-turn-helix domain-containing protein n=1 Tax=Kitasatospora sp. NPDC088548 TaxID=3364075 RepID=UPI003828BB59
MGDLVVSQLEYLRRARGWSLDDMARHVKAAAVRVGMASRADRQRIRKWEHGVRPDPDAQLFIALAFDFDAAVVVPDTWPAWLPGLDTVLPLTPGNAIHALREAASHAMDRRSFVTIGGAGIVSLATEWAATSPAHAHTPPAGQAVDTELVTWVETTTRQLTMLPTMQRQHMGTLLDAHLTTIANLIEHGTYTEATGMRLHAQAATVAKTCAWFRFDHGQHAAAARLWHAAAQSAHQSDDRELGAGILSDLAYQATWLGDPATARDTLTRTLAKADHPISRSLLHLRRARAFSSLGDATACRADLTAAEKFFARRSDDPAPDWAWWMTEDDLLVDSGRCLSELGDHTQALPMIERGVAAMTGHREKTSAVFLAYETEALLRTDAVDQAADCALRALEIADRIGAPRCVDLVRATASEFSKHRTVSGVDQVLARLAG